MAAITITFGIELSTWLERPEDAIGRGKKYWRPLQPHQVGILALGQMVLGVLGCQDLTLRATNESEHIRTIASKHQIRNLLCTGRAPLWHVDA